MGLKISVCEECGEVLAPPRRRCPECRREMKVIEVAYGSDKYFDLLSREPELGKYLALGTKVIICYKGKCYKVEE